MGGFWPRKTESARKMENATHHRVRHRKTRVLSPNSTRPRQNGPVRRQNATLRDHSRSLHADHSETAGRNRVLTRKKRLAHRVDPTV